MRLTRLAALAALALGGATAAAAQGAGSTQDTTHRMAGDSARMRQMHMMHHAQQDSAHPKRLVRVKDEHGLAAQAAVSGDSAQHIALDTVGSGRVTSAELERDGDRLLYEIKVAATGRRGLEQVRVDAATGQVVEVKHYAAARGKVKRYKESKKLEKAERKGEVKPSP